MNIKQNLGIFCILAGFYMLFEKLGLLHFSFISLIAKLWPVFLIAFGFQIIFSKNKKTKWYVLFSLALLFFGYGLYIEISSSYEESNTYQAQEKSQDKFVTNEIDNSDHKSKEIDLSNYYSQVSKLNRDIDKFEFSMTLDSASINLSSSKSDLLYDLLAPKNIRLDYLKTNSNTKKCHLSDLGTESSDEVNINLSPKLDLSVTLDISDNQTHLFDLSNLNVTSLDLSTNSSDLYFTISNKSQDLYLNLYGKDNNIEIEVLDEYSLNIVDINSNLSIINSNLESNNGKSLNLTINSELPASVYIK